MTRILALILGLLLLPGAVFAATVAADEDLTLSEASPGNAYLAGTDVRITAPITGDASALGATILLLAPVGGDALFAGGTVETEGAVDGDIRAAAGRITINGSATGDIFVAGGQVRISGKGTDMRVAGVDVELTGGSDGPTEVYGANVYLAGEFNGNVTIFASDHLTLAEGTIIHGILEYDAPQQADIPATAVIDGGVEYTGSSSYLPTNEEAQTFAIAGAGIFLMVRLIAGMLTAGLAAGLFPTFTKDVSDRVLFRSLRRFILLTLLGFGIVVATPILLFFLIASFVGIGIALVLGLAYLFLLVLSYIYAGVLAGAAIARGILKRKQVSWRAGIIGFLTLHVIGFLPIVGPFFIVILSAAAAGSIVSVAYSFAFGRDTLEEV